MRGKHKSRHQNKNNRLPTIAVIILVSALAVTLAAANGCTAAQKHGEPPADTVHISPPLPTPAQTPTATPAQTPLPTPAQTPLPTPAQTPTEIPTEVPTETPLKLASATIAVTGDILMHTPIVNAGRSGDTYNFDSIFAYIKNYVSAADYAAANLETTLAGTENGYAYSGYPDLNTPDEIVDAVKAAGFDMLLTANNHCYDTASAGFNRTPGMGILELDRISKLVNGYVYPVGAFGAGKAALVCADPQFMDFAVGADLSTGYLELKDFNHGFRIAETAALRIKDPAAIVIFE